MKSTLLFCICTIYVLGLTFSQTESEKSSIPLNTGARYISGENGTIRMYVNIWGYVSNPGRILVDHGIDLSTLLSLSGGPNKGVNLKKVSKFGFY